MKKGYNVNEIDDIHSIPMLDEDLILSLKRVLRLSLQISLGLVRIVIKKFKSIFLKKLLKSNT